MKKFISIILVLVLTFSICFQCSITSSAIAGVDDAVILGVCLDLLALGITMYSVQEFCQSDLFYDFCRDIGNHVDSGIETIIRNGELFVATTKTAWQDICSWVKSKFSSLGGRKNIQVDGSASAAPSSITLKNGSTVPYAEWMSNPFFIYQLPNGAIRAWYCSGRNPGVNILESAFRIWCTGSGTCYRLAYISGSWSNPTRFEMNYGLTYKGQTGSFFDVTFNSGDLNYNPVSTFVQYRTMERVMDNGTSQEQSPPNQVPEVSEPITQTIAMENAPEYYPGAVNAPTEVIENGELVLIKVPQELVVDGNTSNPSLTTDRAAIGNVVSEMVPADVNPRVLTNTQTAGATVDEIIADTPVQELVPDANDPAVDIETANKFRLPQSFLEGFPFSIPYSIYVGIQSFVAEPQAPSFNIPFSIPRLGISENVDIDLSQFSPVARLCRALLSLVWVAGLAMACSKFIKR